MGMTSRRDEPISSVHAGARGSQVPEVPDAEHLDEARVQEDLADPEAKHNATDGYAPAEDPAFGADREVPEDDER